MKIIYLKGSKIGPAFFFHGGLGKKFEPFYIGETLRIRGRLKSHLKAKNIAFVLLDIDPKSEIKGGVRYFHYGYLKTTSKAKAKTCTKIVQRYLIREAISREIRLINKNLVTVQTHALTFSGSKRSRAIYGKRANIEK